MRKGFDLPSRHNLPMGHVNECPLLVHHVYQKAHQHPHAHHAPPSPRQGLRLESLLRQASLPQHHHHPSSHTSSHYSSSHYGIPHYSTSDYIPHYSTSDYGTISDATRSGWAAEGSEESDFGLNAETARSDSGCGGSTDQEADKCGERAEENRQPGVTESLCNYQDVLAKQRL